MKTVLAAAALAVVLATPALARDQLPTQIRASLELKDGTIVHVFQDGKMAKEDRHGRTSPLKVGEVIELKDGRKVKAHGNELARLQTLLEHDRGN